MSSKSADAIALILCASASYCRRVFPRTPDQRNSDELLLPIRFRREGSRSVANE